MSEEEATKARLAELYAKQEAATGWGAAVGARHEEIKGLESQLAALQRPSTDSVPPDLGAWKSYVEDDYYLSKNEVLALIAEVERFRGVAQPPIDPTNHHNALKCPYCNPDGLNFAHPTQGGDKGEADDNWKWGLDYGKDLLADLNQLAHTAGTTALLRDGLQRAYKEIVRLRKAAATQPASNAKSEALVGALQRVIGHNPASPGLTYDTMEELLVSAAQAAQDVLAELPRGGGNAIAEILKHVRAPNRPASERLDRIEEICTSAGGEEATYDHVNTVTVAWIAFAGNGNIRLWTSDVTRARKEKEGGLDMRAFTLAELVALAGRSRDPAYTAEEPVLTIRPLAWRSREIGTDTNSWRAHSDDPTANMKAYSTVEHEIEPLGPFITEQMAQETADWILGYLENECSLSSGTVSCADREAVINCLRNLSTTLSVPSTDREGK